MIEKYSLYEGFTDGSGNDISGNQTQNTTATTTTTSNEEKESISLEIPPKKESNKEVVDVVQQIFENANLYVLAILLVVYVLVFIVFGMYIQRDGQSQERSISFTFDCVLFGTLFVYAVYRYMNMNVEDKENISNVLLSKFVELYDNELALYSVMLFVISFYLLLFLLRIPLKENKPSSVIFIEGISWILLATLLIHNLIKYFFNYDLLDSLRNKDYSKYLDNVMEPEMDASGNVLDVSGNEPDPVPEVFNISNNLYSYEDAQAICKSMDARLATYDEVETSYNNGGEWCSYGWSDGQMALFPTQKKTWDELQKGDAQKKHSCGRPGVNGGYFRNPNVKFGVNCFGNKPKAKDIDAEYMELKQDGLYPRTAQDQRMLDKIEYYKQNADAILVNSFNKDKWSRY